MSSISSSTQFGEGWSQCEGNSHRTSIVLRFLQDQESRTYMINLNRLLQFVMKSRRGQSKAIEVCKNWTGEKGRVFHFFEEECYFNSEELEMVLTLLHSEHLINEGHVERVLMTWEDIRLEFEADMDEDASGNPFSSIRNTKRKMPIVEEDDDADAFDPIEGPDEDDAEDDAEEEFEEGRVDEIDTTRPMEMDERERMIRLNCEALASLTSAGTYLMSRDPHQHMRTLDDIDASVINVTRELQRFVPIGNQQPIQVEDVLAEGQYADKAVRVNRRARDLGHSLANLDQYEYRSMLKEVGIRASNLHRQVYGRKPKKIRMMSGGGRTTHFNFYSENTAPRTLDVAIREWFRNRNANRAEEHRAQAPILDQAFVDEEEDISEHPAQKRPRTEQDDEEFNNLVREAEDREEDSDEICQAAEEYEQQDQETTRSLFTQFFGNL